jgi:hypothetical protein
MHTSAELFSLGRREWPQNQPHTTPHLQLLWLMLLSFCMFLLLLSPFLSLMLLHLLRLLLLLL